MESAPRSAALGEPITAFRYSRILLPRHECGREAEVPAWDEDQASADARSSPASLLHRWQGSSDVLAAAFHATQQRG